MQDDKRVPARHAGTPMVAIGLVVASTAFISLQEVTSKFLLLTGQTPLFLYWCRCLVHVAVVIIAMGGRHGLRVFTPRSWPGQIVRSILLAASAMMTLFGLQTIQIAEAATIGFFSPMLITALAGPMLGEWAGPRRLAAIAAGLLGIVLVMRPGFRTIEIGHLFAFGAMSSYSIYVLMTRKMSASETPQSLMLLGGLIPVVLLLPFAPAAAGPMAGPAVWLGILMLGFFAVCGNGLSLMAYSRAASSTIAPYQYAHILWTIPLGYVFFAQWPDNATLAGALVIILSGLYLIIHEKRQHRRTLQGPPEPGGAT